ncbi:pyridoxal phosphate-dependent aminotransferase [Aspergillus foveolatus]|uniref:pyridoxal phosphate-dependent aminotransferase n=1 Tax=Aspergillus foveolatus TaxID=210207 RepID=UPI003CCD0C9B
MTSHTFTERQETMLGQSASSLSRRARSSLKSTSNALWDALNDIWHPQSNPHGYVTLGVADNTLMQQQLLLRANSSFELSEQHLALNDTITGSPRLKAAIAGVLSRYLRPSKPLRLSHILATNGVASAIEHCSWALCDPGDGILVGRPYFRGFNRDICLRPTARLVQVSFEGVDPLSVCAVSRYEEALISSGKQGCAIRAIMLCNPHNPLGRCYPRSFLIEMMKLCQRFGVHLISDEIYALSVWREGQDGAVSMDKFTSVLSIDHDGLIDPSLVHVLWGVSKDFGANGMRLGAVISQANSDLLESIRGVAQYSSVSGLADCFTTNILEDERFVDQFIAENNKSLAATYEYVVAYMDRHGIPYARGSNAGFFVWCDLLTPYLKLQPASSLDVSESAKAIKNRELLDKLSRFKVHLGVGGDFGSEQAGWFRITFSQSREQLDEGLRRIIDALRS